MRIAVVLAATCLVIGMSVAAQSDAGGRRYELNIPRQSLDTALKDLAQQTGLQIARFSDTIDGKAMVGPVTGSLTTQQALENLLSAQGLSYKVVNDKTIAIVRPGAEAADNRSEPDKPVADGSPADPGLRVAQNASSVGGSKQTTAKTSTAGSEDKIQEIIVTAQKRVERLEDVPVPVAVINAETLVDNNQLRLQDYYAKIPGLNLTFLGNTSTPAIAIRGVSTGSGNPTVGIVVDDVPFTSSTGQGLAADFNPSELARVEVLRGPQGTLYGASSMGGLLKYVTVDPSTDEMSGRVQIGTSAVHKSDELGYSVNGAVNVPMSETFAVRVSGSGRRDPGYVDNLRTGQKDINSTDGQSARIAALWKPLDAIKVKVGALYQHNETDGSAVVTLPSPVGPRPDLGDLQQSILIGTGTHEDEFQAYSAIVTAKMGRGELISVTGYNVNKLDEVYEQEAQAANALRFFGVSGANNQSHGQYSKFTQELRLSMPLSRNIEWLLGGFFTHERSSQHSNAPAVNPVTGVEAGSILRFDGSGEYDEYALFTDLTFQVTDRFDVQVGGRASRNKIVTNPSVSAGPFNITQNRADPFITPAFEAKDSPLTYLLTPRFKISPDLMVYARMASGYRPGGSNTNSLALAAGLPSTFDPDTTRTYEVGFKGDVLDRALSFDASVYYIDWKNVQVTVRDAVQTTLQYTANSAAAVSKGAELTVEFRPLESLTLTAWGAYNKANFKDIPATSTVVHNDDRLPYGAPRSGSLAINQEFSLWNLEKSYVGASLSYVGERKGRFFAGVPQNTFPAYTQVDFRTGTHFGSWDLNAYVNNATDKRGVLRSGRDATNSVLYNVTYTQPRTFGLNLGRTF